MDTSHGHVSTAVPAGQFKQKCLALLDEVASSGNSIVVTKRGRPVARVVPMESPGTTIKGSVRILTDDDSELYSTGEGWEAEETG